jgi:hypothetical protein
MSTYHVRKPLILYAIMNEVAKTQEMRADCIAMAMASEVLLTVAQEGESVA